jgi:rod shape-determining protein MreC
MSDVRSWWDRHGGQAVLATLAIGAGWFVHQTQALPISELYAFLASPLQRLGEQVSPEEKLTNARILELEQKVTELEQENQQLTKFLKDFKQQKQPGIIARIIGRSPDSWWQQITLNKGSADKIAEGFIVTGIGGLIGQVTEVTPHTSRVVLLSDPSSRVGVVTSRTRDPGLIQGQGSQSLVMHFFKKVPNVRPGDAIATSSSSRIYPSGLPIGKVKSIKVTAKGPIPEAIVELTAPIDHLEWVTIHPFENK